MILDKIIIGKVLEYQIVDISDEEYFGAIVNIHGKHTMNNTNIMSDNEMLVRLKIHNQLIPDN